MKPKMFIIRNYSDGNAADVAACVAGITMILNAPTPGPGDKRVSFLLQTVAEDTIRRESRKSKKSGKASPQLNNGDQKSGFIGADLPRPLTMC